MNDLSWCYCDYQVPFQGVSMYNPSGHLLTAIRNSGERYIFKNPVDQIYKQGCFQVVQSQLMLRGVLGLSDWEVMFVPCVNRNEVKEEEVDVVRQILSLALSRTEPCLYQNWASGLPGSIGIAKIDYILLKDDLGHVYKFDPITNVWSPTVDGVKSNSRLSRAIFSNTNSKLPKKPLRLMLFTTDLEILSFQFCYLNKDEIHILNKQETRLFKKNLKQIFRNFVRDLCARISFVRRSSGYILADQYANHSLLKVVATTTNATTATIAVNNNNNNNDNSNNNPSDIINNDDLTETKNDKQKFVKKNSINPFLSAHIPENEATELDYKPINSNPVDPVNRLLDTWLTVHKEHELIENNDFAYCRTYPLAVFTVPFKNSFIIVRDCFEGHRFPILSYYYDPRVIGAKSGIWILRSGKLLAPPPYLERILDVNTKYTIRNASIHAKPYLIHIKLSDLPLNIVLMKEQQKVEIFKDLLNNAAVTILGNNNTSGTQCGHSKHFTDVIESEVNWSVPLLTQVQKCWSCFKSLLQLSQIHVPDIKARWGAESRSVTSRSPNDSVDKFSLNNHNQSCREEAEFTDVHCGQNELSLFQKLKHFSFRSRSMLSLTNSIDSDIASGSSNKQNYFPNNVPLRSSLNSNKLETIAFQRSPHRSSWFDHFLQTNWLDLIRFTIKLATNLVDLFQQVLTNSICQNLGTYVLISGPDSGRTWQPLVISLAQIMFSGETRTLQGFEDLIEREWVRFGYPFTPDPVDWHDTTIHNEYEHGVLFALFLDCVHQLLIEFPTQFAFTQDYLVLLLDCALSRGGGTPPFAIEFACSCEAARCVNLEAKMTAQILTESENCKNKRTWRSFRDWSNVLTKTGLELLPNWFYWWQFSKNPMSSLQSSDLNNEIMLKESSSHGKILVPSKSQQYYPHIWTHAWLRWNRSIRLTNGGGYAFDSAYYRLLLGPKSSLSGVTDKKFTCYPHTSSSPYTGWMSDESIQNAISTKYSGKQTLNHLFTINPTYKLIFELAGLWDTQFEGNLVDY